MKHMARTSSLPTRAGLRSLVSYVSTSLVVLISGIVLVVMLLYIPRAVLGTFREPPAGWGHYLSMVGAYLQQLLQGQLTTPTRNTQAWRDLGQVAYRSAVLLLVSFGIALPLGIGWGALLVHTHRPLLRTVAFGSNMLFLALPSFALLLLLMELVANFTLHTGIRLAYIQGFGIDRHLVLPAGVLAIRGAAYIARGAQAAQDDVLAQEWIRVARAKGFGGWYLWRRHVLPALRLPLLGIVLGAVRVLVHTLVIIDFMSGWGGLGSQIYSAVRRSTNGESANNPLVLASAVLLVIFFVGLDRAALFFAERGDPRRAGKVHAGHRT
jgi:ABC-type dipeptide/oligopeptide/nickel transport system permease component